MSLNQTALPEREENPKGLHRRFEVSLKSGEVLPANFESFILKTSGEGDLEHIAASQEAMLIFYESVGEALHQANRHSDSYHICRADGQPLPDGYSAFVLRFDSGAPAYYREASLKAILKYADEIKSSYPSLAMDLKARYLKR